MKNRNVNENLTQWKKEDVGYRLPQSWNIKYIYVSSCLFSRKVILYSKMLEKYLW